MRLNQPINRILDSETKVKVLRYLCTAGGETSGRQIAQLLRAPTTTVQVALRGLHDEGVLDRRSFGKAYAFSLNTKNWVVAKVLKPMFKTEGNYPSELWTEISKKVERSKIKKAVLSVVLFGSVLTKQERPTSDIDLLILIDDGKAKQAVEDLFIEMNATIIQEAGLSLEPHIYSVAEFRDKVAEGLPFIKAALHSDKIILGKRLEVFL